MAKPPPRARDRTPRREILLPKVKALRIAKAASGVTLNQMAADLERHRSWICSVLHGARTSAITAKQIADYFEVPVEELFERIDLEKLDKASAA